MHRDQTFTRQYSGFQTASSYAKGVTSSEAKPGAGSNALLGRQVLKDDVTTESSFYLSEAVRRWRVESAVISYWLSRT
jgi:hypothetical protein